MRPPKFLLPAVYATSLLSKVGDGFVVSSSPVVWAEATKIRVSNRLGATRINIDLANSCDVLASLYHEDLQSDALKHCNKLYQEMVLDELRQWCPKENKKRKRFIFVGIFVVIGMLAAVGAGVAVNTYTSQSNSKMIEQLGSTQSIQNEMIEKIEQQAIEAHNRVNNFTTKYNMLVNKLKNLSKDYNEFKGTMVRSVMETSALISQFAIKRMQIRQAKRFWKDSVVGQDLFDIFEFKLPCNDSVCPLGIAKPIDCTFRDDNDLVINLLTPFISDDFTVMQSFPFTFMVKKGGMTCSQQYIGPDKLIVSKDAKCVIQTDFSTQHEVQDGLINLATDYSCMEDFEEAALFNVTDCKPSVEGDHKKYVQVKVLHNEIYVYCKGSEYTLNGITRPCADGIMILPSFSTLKIDDNDVLVDQINVTTHHVVNPELAAVAEDHLALVDSYNFSSVTFDEPDNFKPIKFSDFVRQPIVMYGGPSFLFIIAVCIILFICYKLFFDKQRNSSSLMI